MKQTFRLGLVLLIWCFGVAQAAFDNYQFDSAEQEALYKELVEELRCLVCQNQNIAASNAELAQDLRRLTYEMITEGKNREQILTFMVERYGDFVLYQPPVRNSTLLLWIGPFIALLLALVVVLRKFGSARTRKVELDSNQRQRAAELLARDEDS
jgi:cytochrome c-type biogenesis protein CcmH